MNKLAGRFAGPLLFLLFFSVSMLSIPAQGAEEVVFRSAEDVVLIWARRAGLIVMLFSVLLILFELVMRRHRLMETRAKWMLFLGICVLPLPVMFLSLGVGIEESKAVEFCASCHAPMSLFVQDMQDLGSETLAALHYKNQLIQEDHCWTCHSDYGIAGTTQAKLTGLLHILEAATGKWDTPIELRNPYNWTICLACHGNSARFRAPRGDASAHEGVLQAVLEGEMTCTMCHEMAHPAPEERNSR